MTGEGTSKDASPLREAISTAWIAIHGPVEFLVIEGEGGTTSESVEAYLAACWVQLKPCALDLTLKS